MDNSIQTWSTIIYTKILKVVGDACCDDNGKEGVEVAAQHVQYKSVYYYIQYTTKSVEYTTRYN